MSPSSPLLPLLSLPPPPPPSPLTPGHCWGTKSLMSMLIMNTVSTPHPTLPTSLPSPPPHYHQVHPPPHTMLCTSSHPSTSIPSHPPTCTHAHPPTCTPPEYLSLLIALLSTPIPLVVTMATEVLPLPYRPPHTITPSPLHLWFVSGRQWVRYNPAQNALELFLKRTKFPLSVSCCLR